MKIFALGGCGKVGLPAIRLLAQSDIVIEIAVAGRSLGRVEKTVRVIEDNAFAVRADGTDEEKLTVQLASYDIIVNGAWDDCVVSATCCDGR